MITESAKEKQDRQDHLLVVAIVNIGNKIEKKYQVPTQPKSKDNSKNSLECIQLTDNKKAGRKFTGVPLDMVEYGCRVASGSSTHLI